MVDGGGPALMGWHRWKSGGGRVMDDGRLGQVLDRLEEGGGEGDWPVEGD